MDLHRKRHCIQYNRKEYGVGKRGRIDKPPDLVLDDILGYVALDGPGFQSELNTLTLVLVQITVLEFILTLILEGNNNETDENIDHKESNHDNKGHKEDGHGSAIIIDRSLILTGRIDRLV